MTENTFCRKCDSEDCRCLSSSRVAFDGLPPETRKSTSPTPVPHGTDKTDKTDKGSPVADAAELLDDLARFYSRFLIFQTEHEAVASALWVAHCWAFDAADCTPYIIVQSAEPESGKSRYLEVAEVLVPAPWYIDVPSEAVVYRKIDADHPTVLLDEYNGVFSDKADSAGMQALLCAGFRRGRKVPRCVGQGVKIAVQDFHVFAPKALAGIGRLPDAIETRKIPINLVRKSKDEHVDRFRLRDVEQEASGLRERLATWAGARVDGLRAARPELPVELTDRRQDIWEPLFAIADLAGKEWPALARAAATALLNSNRELSEGVMLLEHIRQSFSDDDRISTEDLLRALVDRDEGPWAVWWSKALDDGNLRGPASKLASKLRAFGISSKQIRSGEKTGKGYERAAFEDTWRRYLPLPKADETLGTNGTPQVGPTSTVSTVTSVSSPTGEKASGRTSMDLSGWTWDHDPAPCIVCGTPCVPRDPEGVARHPACPPIGVAS